MNYIFAITALIIIAVICVSIVIGERILTYVCKRSERFSSWCEKHIYNYDLMEE